MARPRSLWPFAGLVAGVAGLLVSYAVAAALAIREAPVPAIAETVIQVTPGNVAETAIRFLQRYDKPFLVVMVVLISLVLFAVVGAWSRRRWWLALAAYVVLAALAAAAVLTRAGTGVTDLLPVAAGFVTWVVVLMALTEPLRRAEAVVDSEESGPTLLASTRRQLVVRGLLFGGAAAAVAVGGRFLGRGRRQVEASRSLLRLDGVSRPRMPVGANIGVEGLSGWATSSHDFYRIDTAIVTPTITPADWTLRIHGLVDRELVLTYEDLIARGLTDAWVTLNCVSNPVGGDLVGNAWWSGVLIRSLLAEVGVHPDADAVLQTSDDGWTCGTPLAALTDPDRNAMLAVAMNGEPLPIDHGFPVRTIVPGLYGYVSATKWVREYEVTRFSDITAYWTQRGWGERGPVKMASRIDVPQQGSTVAAGSVQVGGFAWLQHTGISAVQVSLDGGSWTGVDLGRVPNADTWVQWAGTLDVAPGDHVLRVRAIDENGEVQTSVVRDVLPDGATGLDGIAFTAKT
ncbi:molybdopterin-dependent oxidoreductase [Nocardioides acrostichi]|uniref:Molybdopterin-dependent oxidoreductase n=1 Tax=Nocardioides acrostichi TaxID=2784339 RepID=A0A930UXG8_9ACTN|nr:molybdopterin-dependent oxidoreductase [Nocardioides acrostichi]MBF4161487.1 molybdopterin-dependent oxidoreductase [Nocardioides acrostichi]